MIHSIVGIAKALWPNKDQEFKLDYFLFNLLLAGFLGAIAGILAGPNRSNEVAFLAGYAGPDFLESLFKLKFGQVFKG